MSIPEPTTFEGPKATGAEPANAPSTKRTRAEATAIPEPRPYSGPATRHLLRLGDARDLDWIADESVHLVVTSPPYLNRYDYFDVDADQDIDVPNDIFRVILAYLQGPLDAGGPGPNYSTAKDRGAAIGPNSWNRYGPDGVQRAGASPSVDKTGATRFAEFFA